MNSSLPTTLSYSPVSPPLPSHTNIPEKHLPKTPPEKKSSFMRSVLSLGPRSRRSPVQNSNPSAVSLNSSCSSSQSSLATPPTSRSCSPAAHRFQYEQESTPPSSPDKQLCKIKRVIYQNEKCQVFHWKDESWYATNACILQVRETHGQQMCVTVQLKATHEVYMNAWILPSLTVLRISDTDIGLTVKLGEGEEEEYLLHCSSHEETDRLDQLLQQALDSTEVDLQLAMTCKCKLYLQSSSSKWRSFGAVQMNVSQHLKSKKMHMAIESHKGDKTQLLVSAMVQSRNVERLGPKQISFLLTSETESRVYMVKIREESTGDKIIEYLKEKNAELGW
ncbi:hypothetical protein BY458DRAFT_523439 [Sporodiniella umbellata]|nr:hypothetical protein BY458DRAFT_523439 [Sporodiniella umbellata]